MIIDIVDWNALNNTTTEDYYCNLLPGFTAYFYDQTVLVSFLNLCNDEFKSTTTQFFYFLPDGPLWPNSDIIDPVQPLVYAAFPYA